MSERRIVYVNPRVFDALQKKEAELREARARRTPPEVEEAARTENRSISCAYKKLNYTQNNS